MKLFNRLATSSVLIPVIGYILFFGGVFYFSLLVTFFILLALREFFVLVKKKHPSISDLFGMFMGMIIPLVVYFEAGLSQSGEVLFLVLGCLFLFVLKFLRGHADSLIGISLTLFGMLYVSWFLSFLIKIRLMQGGVYWVAYLLCVTKSADIGAYTVGSLIGKNRLIPQVSPKKTVEGIIGGLIFSALCSLAFIEILPLSFEPIYLIMLGILIGTVGQVGDLSESLLKRCCETKDSGDALPGMGGFLDAVDSVLFTAPIFYYHLKLFV